MPGAPAPSGVPLGAPQAARFALNDLAKTAPGQTLAPRGARGTPLRPHTGQYASQGDRRSPNKQVQEQTRQSSTADLIARNAAAGTTKAKKFADPIGVLDPHNPPPNPQSSIPSLQPPVVLAFFQL